MRRDAGMRSTQSNAVQLPSRGVAVYPRMSVCVYFSPHDISKTDVARITKLHIEMFHDESWKLIYFWVKR